MPFIRKKCFIPGKAQRLSYSFGKARKDGKLRAVVTQNVDGLHQEAGSREVYGFTARYTEIIVQAAVNATSIYLK